MRLTHLTITLTMARGRPQITLWTDKGGVKWRQPLNLAHAWQEIRWLRARYESDGVTVTVDDQTPSEPLPI